MQEEAGIEDGWMEFQSAVCSGGIPPGSQMFIGRIQSAMKTIGRCNSFEVSNCNSFYLLIILKRVLDHLSDVCLSISIIRHKFV